MSHRCTSCHRVLRNEFRDALCLQCIETPESNEFGEDAKTSPNIVPRELQERTHAVA